MLKRLLLGLLLASSVVSVAQENLNFGKQKEITSPQINADKTVTFRIMAPNATKVEL